MPATPPPAPKQPSRAPPKAPAAGTPSADQLRYLQQIYQNQYMAMAQELNGAIEVLQNLETVLTTLEGMSNLKDKNTLIPIGPSVYMDGKITNAKSVVLGIGAGYMVEKDVDSAKGYITKMIDKETQHINRLNKSKKELEAALMEISYKVDELAHSV